MFPHVRVIRRALIGDIQRDFDSVIPRDSGEAAEIVERSKLWVNRFVAAFGASDRPGTSRILRGTFGGIVPPFTMRGADWMNRREVEHIETHRGNFGNQ